MATYKNSFHNPKWQDSKPKITTDAEPIEYNKHLIYQRQKDCFDIVKDGVCIGMYAGLNGAKNRIDNIKTKRK